MKYSGIDLHSNNSVVVVTDEQDYVLEEKRVPNDLAVIVKLLEPHREELAGVVVESTFNWYWLVDGLMESGYAVKLANPAAIKKYAGLKHSGDETDEVWTPGGLVTYYVLFIIHLLTRSVHIAGVTTAPNGGFMKQVARNLTDVRDGFLLNSRHLIMDLDTNYTNDFRGHLDREGVKPVRCPVRAPNCNAFAERFVRSIKDECLGRMILFGEASLRRALRVYMAH